MHKLQNFLFFKYLLRDRFFLTLFWALGICFQMSSKSGEFFSKELKFQQTEFTGKVIDQSGEALPGVEIFIKNSKKGAVTDFDGLFSIQANIGDVIIFKSAGFKEYTLVYANQKNLVITLEDDIESLEEVVVIGYGKVTKKEVTGAISQVKGEELRKIVTPSVEQALQGQVAGVNITASGRPGGDPIVEIRGISSLSGDSTPLYVVDGIPQPGVPRLNSNEIETIDIIKDAASAAIYGVQGGHGVILITTKKPKEGKAQINFDYTTGIQRIISEKTPLLNSSEQLYARNVAIRNGGPFFSLNVEDALRNDDFDIRDVLIIDDALQSTYNLGVSGGSKEISYNVSGTYHEQEGVIINSNFKRHNVRASTVYDKGRLRVQTSMAYRQENGRDPRFNILPQSLTYRPYNGPLDLNADLVNVSEGDNFLTQGFVASIREKNKVRRDIVNLSTNVSYKLMKSLTFKSWMGYFTRAELRNRFIPQFATIIDRESGLIDDNPLNSSVGASSSISESYNLDNTIEWDKRFGKHHIKVLGGFSFQRLTSSFFEASRQGVANNNIQVINGGTINERAASGVNFRENRNSRRLGALSRIQYDFKKKYLLSLVGRYDSSSVFGPGLKSDFFKSIAVAWNVSDESFWSSIKPVVNRFKLRASLGETGNDRIPPYIPDLTIANTPGFLETKGETQVTGFTALQYSNPGIKWETTIQRNFGADIALFKNKISLAAEIYKDERKDLLLPVRLPASAGSDNLNIIANVGKLENTGFELEFKYKDQIGNLKYNIGATYSQNKNIVKELSRGAKRIVHTETIISGDPSSNVGQFRVGRPASAYFLYDTDGVINTEEELGEYTVDIQVNDNGQLVGNGDSQIVRRGVTNILGQQNIRTGDLKIIDQITEDNYKPVLDAEGNVSRDANGNILLEEGQDGILDSGDGIINDEDRVYKGSGLPDYTVGFNLGLEYKGFDFSMNWYASVGNEVINGPRVAAFNRNRHRELLSQWTVANQDSNIPAYRGISKTHFNYAGSTDLWIEDGSFIRLKQIGIGYTIPSGALENLGINSFRMSLSAQNILTITDYSGFDPEITNPNGGNNIRNRGLDIGNYPIAGQYLFGLQVQF